MLFCSHRILFPWPKSLQLSGRAIQGSYERKEKNINMKWKVIKFQECAGSTTSMQSASNFHSWPFYFLWIKKISNSLFILSLKVNLSFLHRPVSFVLFLFLFFFCQQFLSFSLYHLAISSLSFEQKRPKFYEERHEMEDLRAKGERVQSLKETEMQRRRFCDLWVWLVFVIYGFGLCCLCTMFEEIYGMKMKMMKREMRLFWFWWFMGLVCAGCVMCLKKFMRWGERWRSRRWGVLVYAEFVI